MHGLAFDIAHLLAGSLVLVSFMQLYQDRLSALINIFAIHALVLGASVAWQASVQGAPHLYVTALIALLFKAIIIPMALRRIIVRLGIHREIENVVGIGLTMLVGIGLVALSMVVMLRVTREADPLNLQPNQPKPATRTGSNTSRPASLRRSLASNAPTLWSLEVTMLTTPGGRSVCSAMSSPSTAAHQGVSGAGLSTMVLPAASAGPSLARLI